jgi:hypothetical protein
MSNYDDRQPETFSGLAKRWLKANLRFHGDPQQARRDRQESEEAEMRMRQKATDDAVNSVANVVLPESWKRKLENVERGRYQRQLDNQERYRAEQEALPHVALCLSVTGDLQASVDGIFPSVVRFPDSPGDALTVEVVPLDPVAMGDTWFQHLSFAIPSYRGPDSYDIAAMARRDGDDWDPLWFMLALDSADEPFYWVADYGPASAHVSDDQRTIQVKMTMQDAGSRTAQVEATVTRNER